MKRVVFPSAGLILCVFGSAVQAANTIPVTSYDFQIASFVEAPNGSEIYASVPSLNEVVSINPNTLSVTGSVYAGSNPDGLALNSSGSELYVADSGSSFVSVINTPSMTANTSFEMPSNHGDPLSLAFGANDQLWVLTTNSIFPIDPSSGAVSGTGISPTIISGGAIRTSSDGSTLYYADYGSSPSYVYQYNISGSTPTQTYSGALGSNGEDLELSHNNKEITLISGGNYNPTMESTSNFATLGTLNEGAYPMAFAFSPDDAVGYASQFGSSNNIFIYNLNDFLQTGTIVPTTTVDDMFVDNTGQYLFAGENGLTQVFATGRDVPEPATGVLLLSVAASQVLRRRREISRR